MYTHTDRTQRRTSRDATKPHPVRTLKFPFITKSCGEVLAMPVLKTIEDPYLKIQFLSAVHFKEADRLMQMWPQLDEAEQTRLSKNFEEVQINVLGDFQYKSSQIIVFWVGWVDEDNNAQPAKLGIIQEMWSSRTPSQVYHELLSVYPLKPNVRAEVSSTLAYTLALVWSIIGNTRVTGPDDPIRWPNLEAPATEE